MKFSKRTKFMLFGSLILIAISLRYPTTPHEIGWDAFFIHGLINSLNVKGQPEWWIHPFSTFGLTPFSYASAAPFLLSGFSQASGLSIESSIWLFGVLCGILGIFGSYMVAKEFMNNDIYIFFVVFGFTTSEIFLNYTTWTITTRGFFIAFLPFFIFFILKKGKFRQSLVTSILVILLFVYLVAIHHLYSFLVFPMISFLIIYRSYPFKNIKKLSFLRKIIMGISILFLIVIPIFIIFDVISLMYFHGISREVIGQPKINWLWYLIRGYSRNLGILGLFSIPGFFILVFKREKSFNEIVLIFFMLVLLPFILIVTYMTAFIAILIYVITGFALFHIYSLLKNKINRNFALFSIFIVLSISFASSIYFQLEHPSTDIEAEFNERYLEEETYDTGLWSQNWVDNDIIFSNDDVSSVRIAGVMGIKQFPGRSSEQYMNGYISIEDVKIVRRSPLKPEFWSDSFYEIKASDSSLAWKAIHLTTEKINDSKFFETLIREIEIKYVIENNDKFLNDNNNENIFFKSVNENRYKLYSNEMLSVWYIY